MSLYDELQSVARDVLGTFAQGTVAYVSLTAGSGPVDDPGAATETEHVLSSAVVRGVSQRYLIGGLAVATDLEVTTAIVPGLTFSLTGFVKIDGVRHKIVQIIGKPAAGTPVVFTLIVRK
jgi:hypothetical protein